MCWYMSGMSNSRPLCPLAWGGPGPYACLHSSCAHTCLPGWHGLVQSNTPPAGTCSPTARQNRHWGGVSTSSGPHHVPYHFLHFLLGWPARCCAGSGLRSHSACQLRGRKAASTARNHPHVLRSPPRRPRLDRWPETLPLHSLLTGLGSGLPRGSWSSLAWSLGAQRG